MPTTARETNTMAEGLRKILNEITSLKMMPDSDLEFITSLETAILGYLRNPVTPEQAPAAPPMVGGSMGGGSPQGFGPSSPGMAVPMIPPDELRRMVGTNRP